jgi:hypothetical protein
VIGNSMRLSEKIGIRLDESWRKALSPDAQRSALAIAGPYHAQFGYASQ